MYTKKFKTLLRKTEEDLSKWRHVLCLWFGIVNIVKMKFSTKVSTDLRQSLSESQDILSKNEQADTKMNMEMQGCIKEKKQLKIITKLEGLQFVVS